VVTTERVIDPAAAAAAEAGRAALPTMASRWSVRADNADQAWEALSPWRGLRAPGRLEAVDPAVLRERADGMDRAEILGSYSMVSTAQDYVEVYSPLVTDLNADVVTIQTTTLDQEATIAMLGSEVLPALRALAD
jgi:coenzyme F420-dependent glucose-6-phosphate dehydrogenase